MSAAKKDGRVRRGGPGRCGAGARENGRVDVVRLYGPAEDVPDLLRAAASEDDEVRGEAIYELFGAVHHQGTVYPASAPAVPFLARLAVGAPHWRDHLLMLLAEAERRHAFPC